MPTEVNPATASENRIVDFMNGFAAAVQLSRRAAEAGFMIEFIVLAASVIDGALRIGLVLEHQIATSSSDIEDELVHQGETAKALSEREIYRRALDRGVIDQCLFDDLQTLYSARNRVVHRYVISEITTEAVFQIALRFEETIERVNGAVRAMEDRQVERGVGMTGTGQAEKAVLDSMVREKHGARWLAQAFQRRET
jgi:uncharacterized protein YutE (UPF0331/DUF86 family)